MAEKNSSDGGQSTIEFIMTFTAAVGFIFLFLKLAMNYTSGYMVHHATYMAARSYLVVDEERDGDGPGDDAALAKAKTVFTRYLPPGLVNGVDVEELEPNKISFDMNFAAFIGLWIQYTQAFSLGFVGGKAPVIFRSEAFLGREPTRFESVSQVCIALKSAIPGKSCSVHVTLDDNGG
jgi:hypothetical protein